MCSFRNSLIRRLSVLVYGFALAVGISGIVLPQRSYAVGNSESFFPLNVGNYWNYRCSAEGEYQFNKTIRLVSVITRNNVQYFRTELQVQKDKPLVYYMFVDTGGQVYSAPDLGSEGSELLVTVKPKANERIGTMTVAGNEQIDLPTLKHINAVRIENFNRDDPDVSAERRIEWMGRYYAQGIGLVMEADGLGGECVLMKYHLNLH